MNPHLNNFFDYTNEHIANVITYHLNIEALLEQMLRQNLVDSSVLDFERMMFAQKASLVRSLGLIDRPIYEVIRKMNSLRNKFSHKLGYSPTFVEVHQLVIEAGKAGVEFTDGIDTTNIAYVRSLNYDESGLLNALFRNVFFAIAWGQDESFWHEVLT